MHSPKVVRQRAIPIIRARAGVIALSVNVKMMTLQERWRQVNSCTAKSKLTDRTACCRLRRALPKEILKMKICSELSSSRCSKSPPWTGTMNLLRVSTNASARKINQQVCVTSAIRATLTLSCKFTTLYLASCRES
jgi:hypothetical protein